MSKSVSLDRQVMIRLTNAQAQTLERLADTEGLPVSSLARSGLIKFFNLPTSETERLGAGETNAANADGRTGSASDSTRNGYDEE